MQPPGTELARVDSYQALLYALVRRRLNVGLPQRAVDDLAGYADGYTAKLECGMKRLGTMSFDCLLGAIGVELVVVAKTPHHVAQGRIAPSVPTSTFLRPRRDKCCGSQAAQEATLLA